MIAAVFSIDVAHAKVERRRRVPSVDDRAVCVYRGWLLVVSSYLVEHSRRMER